MKRSNIIITITILIVTMFVMMAFNTIPLNNFSVPSENSITNTGMVNTVPSLAKSSATYGHAKRMEVYNGGNNNVAKYSTDGNWAGYVLTSSNPDFQAICGSWIVQTVSSSPYGNSAQWIGIGGVGNSKLIQTGTASDAGSGDISYQAWYELLPNAPVYLSLNVKPGNIMSASISDNTVNGNSWTIFIKDVTSGKSYTTTVSYNPCMKSAEWIEERPNMSPYTLANFGTAKFGSYYTGGTANQVIYGSSGSEKPKTTQTEPDRVPLPPKYYIGQLSYTMYNIEYNGLLTSTSSLDGTPCSSFTVTWEGSG